MASKDEKARVIEAGGAKITIQNEDPSNVFQLVEVLGSGSYGEVYKGRSISSGEIYAVKIIKLEPGEDLKEVSTEVNFLQSCIHKNIVSYGGSFLKKDEAKGEEQIWIIMEYCGAGSVRDICKLVDGPLTEAQIAVICREALQGLAFLHSIGKIHRDIKGGNILLKDNGEVKLADFGVSAQLDGTLAKRNTFIGTPYWMAPEVIQESSYDGKADVWSIGITAIEMAELVPPHAQVHPMRVLFKILRDPPPKLSRKGTSWSEQFHEFVAKCCVKDPNLRMTSTQALKEKFIETAGSTRILLELVDQSKMAAQLRAETPKAQNDGTVNKLRTVAGTSKSSGTVKVNTFNAGFGDGGGTMVVHKDDDDDDLDTGTVAKGMKSSISREQLMTVDTVNAKNFLDGAPPPPVPISNDIAGTVRIVDVSPQGLIQNISRKHALQLPMVSARSLKSEVLLSPADSNINLYETMRELIPPEDPVPDMILTRYVGNLLRMYAHESRKLDISIDENSIAEHEKTSSNLRLCVKTILKI